MRNRLALTITGLLIFCGGVQARDWSQFRGPLGLGISDEQGIPERWSATDNVSWKADLPGPGASSPITVGNRVYITCYSGYGVGDPPGEQKDLRRHLLCLARDSGKILWHKQFEPKLPEHSYQGEGAYHGYAASTPASDGEKLYVFFGKSGVFCFTLDGEQVWQTSVGEQTHGWGSGTSPLLYKNSVIINASIESGSLIALDKSSGKELWKAKDIRSSWNTPLVVDGSERQELVVSIEGRILSFAPTDGAPLWNADGVHRYVCPSVVSHGDMVYAIGGGHTSLAVRIGGKGDVTATHEIWKKPKGSNVGSPIYHEGHLYWVSDSGGFVCCQEAATGETVYQERLEPRPGTIWSSPILADGKLYIVTQRNGTFVVACKPKFELLAHNVIEGDDSRTNASPIVSNGQLLMRTDRALYCIGKK